MRNSFGISGMERSFHVNKLREVESANFPKHCIKNHTERVESTRWTRAGCYQDQNPAEH